MEDIEDIRGPEDNFERKSTGIVLPKTYKSREKQSVYVKTWGCGHNNSDGEYMAGMLAQDGYNIILEDNKADDADVWVLNSCTVKGPSQQTFENDIKSGIESGKKIVVAGCVPQASPKGPWKDCSVIGVQQIDQIVFAVEETLKGNTVKFLKESKEVIDGKKKKSGGAPLNLPKIRRNPYIEIIPINTGCLNQCTYCKTKHARGDLGSYSVSEILERVATVLDEGVLEIWLTSEDTGAYGRDIGESIVGLLWGIVKVMEEHPSKSMLRIGMTNPPYILEHLDEMAKILNHERVYSFLHVPVQAGSTSVLNDMKRLYVIEDFERVCDVLLDRVDGMTIATDIICGFPTEKDNDFEETMRILEKYRFPVLHISQFYPRPGTPAARLKRVDTRVVKERSRKATKFFNSYKSFDHLIGSVQKVLVTDVSTDGNYYVGHDKSFHQVLIPKDPRFMGREVVVKVLETNKWNLIGEVLDENKIEVEIKRLPQLHRVGKHIVSTPNDEKVEPGERLDGAVFSLGKQGTIKTNDKSRWIKYIGLAGVPILFLPIRNSIKFSAALIGAALYFSN